MGAVLDVAAGRIVAIVRVVGPADGAAASIVGVLVGQLALDLLLELDEHGRRHAELGAPPRHLLAVSLINHMDDSVRIDSSSELDLLNIFGFLFYFLNEFYYLFLVCLVGFFFCFRVDGIEIQSGGVEPNVCVCVCAAEWMAGLGRDENMHPIR